MSVIMANVCAAQDGCRRSNQATRVELGVRYKATVIHVLYCHFFIITYF